MSITDESGAAGFTPYEPKPRDDIKTEKTQLRADARRSRSALDRSKKADYDAEIQSRVLAMREYAGTDLIYTYVSRDTEVSTLGIIRAAWANGKRVAVPKSLTDTYELEFYIIRSPEDLAPGVYGLPEPIVGRCEKVTEHSHGLCVVPGLSFDAEGYRLGYGRGYYDRFLKQFGGTSVGLCYSSYVKYKLPRSEYDMAVDFISTERYLRKT